MVYLNYNNLDGETQERLLKRSREEIENKHGKELRMYAVNYQKDYSVVLGKFIGFQIILPNQ